MGERISISRHEAWVTDDLGNIIGVVGPAGKTIFLRTLMTRVQMSDPSLPLDQSLTGKRLYLAPAKYTISA